MKSASLFLSCTVGSLALTGRSLAQQQIPEMAPGQQIQSSWVHMQELGVEEGLPVVSARPEVGKFAGNIYKDQYF